MFKLPIGHWTFQLMNQKFHPNILGGILHSYNNSYYIAKYSGNYPFFIGKTYTLQSIEPIFSLKKKSYFYIKNQFICTSVSKNEITLQEISIKKRSLIPL